MADKGLSAPVVGRIVGPLVFLLLMMTSGGDLSNSGKKVVAVVCGRNINLDVFKRIIQ